MKWEDWLWWQRIVALGTLAGSLSALVVFKDQVAEAFPLVTKSYLESRLDGLQLAFGDQQKFVFDALNSIAWNQLLDRERALGPALETLRTQKLRLEEDLRTQQGVEERVQKGLRLQAIEQELRFREQELALARCQIEARDYKATCK